jgi:pimeloyl-ACP methyl ester carboxylesterase
MPQPTFDALFAQAPAAQKEALQRFWRGHAPQECVIGNARWRYLCVGQGRRTVLLLPHALAPADIWFHLAGALAPHYRCLIPDGYALQGVYDADLICEALVHIIEAGGAFSAAVIAHGAGGSVAQFLLQRYPHRVQHLVLCHSVALDSQAPMPLRTWRPLLGWAPWALLRPRLFAALAPNLPEGLRWSAFARAYLQWMTQDLDQGKVQRFVQAEGDMRQRFELRPAVEPGWPGRVLAIASTDDPLSYDSLAFLRERYPRCQAVAWNAGGHWAPLLFPEHLAEQVRRFLTGEALQTRPSASARP